MGDGENSSPRKIKRIWSDEEDNMLKKVVISNGAQNWADIAAQIPGRSSKQCRERWHNHLDNGLRKGDWTEEEDQIIITTQMLFGNQWAQTANLLKGRTDNAVKNRFHALQRAKLKAETEIKEREAIARLTLLNGNSNSLLLTQKLIHSNNSTDSKKPSWLPLFKKSNTNPDDILCCSSLKTVAEVSPYQSPRNCLSNLSVISTDSMSVNVDNTEQEILDSLVQSAQSSPQNYQHYNHSLLTSPFNFADVHIHSKPCVQCVTDTSSQNHHYYDSTSHSTSHGTSHSSTTHFPVQFSQHGNSNNNRSGNSNNNRSGNSNSNRSGNSNSNSNSNYYNRGATFHYDCNRVSTHPSKPSHPSHYNSHSHCSSHSRNNSHSHNSSSAYNDSNKNNNNHHQADNYNCNVDCYSTDISSHFTAATTATTNTITITATATASGSGSSGTSVVSAARCNSYPMKQSTAHMSHWKDEEVTAAAVTAATAATAATAMTVDECKPYHR